MHLQNDADESEGFGQHFADLFAAEHLHPKEPRFCDAPHTGGSAVDVPCEEAEPLHASLWESITEVVGNL